MLLALDTSTSEASIALVHEGHTLAELSWQIGQRHSTELLERLDWLLAWRGVSMQTVDGIAVALGPGSFNGVRVAVTTAKSLALALNVPLYGHPTLDVIAWGAALADGPLWAILEAGRSQVYAAAYAAPAASALHWGPVEAYTVVMPTELATRIDRPALICGEWRSETRAALEAAAGERLRFASQLGGRRASWLAELALARAAQGMRDDPATLEPLYLRRPAITTSKKLLLATQQEAHTQHAQPTEQTNDGPDKLEGEGAPHAL